MKKLKTLLCLLVCICALTAVLTVSASAATTEIRKVTLMVDEPTLGAKPNTDIWYSDSKFVDITSVEWKGKLDDNGCFTTNMAYSVIIKLKIKDDANAVYGLIEPEDLTINGTKIANTYHYTNDEKTLTVTHTFPFYLKDNGKKTTLTRISNVSITMPAPLAGAVPATKDLVNDNNSNTYVYGIKWDGELDANGCFKAGVKYKVTIGLKVNENAKYMFNKKMSGVSVNGKLGNDQT